MLSLMLFSMESFACSGESGGEMLPSAALPNTIFPPSPLAKALTVFRNALVTCCLNSR